MSGKIRFTAGPIILAMGFFIFPGCQRKAQNAAPLSPPEVLVTEVVQQDVPVTREWVGTLDGSANAQIRARVQGYLTKQNYKAGTIVKTDDVLFEIDPRPFEAALAEAKAKLAQAQAQQGRTDAEFLKQKELYDKKVTSQRDFDVATQNKLANAANAEAAKASVDQAEINLAFTKITAPIDGLAGVAKPGIGDLVGPGTEELTTISTLDPIKAVFPISEQEYLRAAEQLNAKDSGAVSALAGQLVLADGSIWPDKGKFSVAGRQVDVRTGTVLIESLFPNPGNILRPGQFARVRVITKTQKGALLVPQRAVAELQGSYQVAIVSADNKAEIRPVKVGERVGQMWLIEEGLKPGDRVVVEGIQKVREGMPVDAKPWVSPTPVAETPKTQ
ncbi:MAG TPA: efflux RND transporter periplasmic adaptor subunit [Candidatus Udaeobacter sp.]|jgi:membrane fusion protein (multidrug efflux system)|nr:efflux RND transporter periplasmic adaptor subunit [Candidatus Udaeobacter sp.]